MSSLLDAADVDRAVRSPLTPPTNSISMSSYSPSAPYLGCPSQISLWKTTHFRPFISVHYNNVSTQLICTVEVCEVDFSGPVACAVLPQLLITMGEEISISPYLQLYLKA